MQGLGSAVLRIDGREPDQSMTPPSLFSLPRRCLVVAVFGELTIGSLKPLDAQRMMGCKQNCRMVCSPKMQGTISGVLGN